jgi:hypothetical protein
MPEHDCAGAMGGLALMDACAAGFRKWQESNENGNNRFRIRQQLISNTAIADAKHCNGHPRYRPRRPHPAPSLLRLLPKTPFGIRPMAPAIGCVRRRYKSPDEGALVLRAGEDSEFPRPRPPSRTPAPLPRLLNKTELGPTCSPARLSRCNWHRGLSRGGAGRRSCSRNPGLTHGAHNQACLSARGSATLRRGTSAARGSVGLARLPGLPALAHPRLVRACYLMWCVLLPAVTSKIQGVVERSNKCRALQTRNKRDA